MARVCSIAILVGDIRAFTSLVSQIKPSVTAALYTIFEKNLLTNSLNFHGKFNREAWNSVVKSLLGLH